MNCMPMSILEPPMLLLLLDIPPMPLMLPMPMSIVAVLRSIFWYVG